MYGKDHVTGNETDGGMWVCNNIVEELVKGLFKSIGSLGLVGDNGTEGGNQCGVNNTCIVEKCAHYILDVFDIIWAKWFG